MGLDEKGAGVARLSSESSWLSWVFVSGPALAALLSSLKVLLAPTHQLYVILAS